MGAGEISWKKTIETYGAVDGKRVDLITLTNKNGMTIRVTNYGCIVTSIEVPDKNGQLADVVLGYESLERYLGGHPFFGAVAGRFANRIKDGKFSIGSKTYQLETKRSPPQASICMGGARVLTSLSGVMIWRKAKMRSSFTSIGSLLTENPAILAL